MQTYRSVFCSIFQHRDLCVPSRSPLCDSAEGSSKTAWQNVERHVSCWERARWNSADNDGEERICVRLVDAPSGLISSVGFINNFRSEFWELACSVICIDAFPHGRPFIVLHWGFVSGHMHFIVPLFFSAHRFRSATLWLQSWTQCRLYLDAILKSLSGCMISSRAFTVRCADTTVDELLFFLRNLLGL